VFPLQEMAGLAGDGYTITMSVPGPAAQPPRARTRQPPARPPPPTRNWRSPSWGPKAPPCSTPCSAHGWRLEPRLCGLVGPAKAALLGDGGRAGWRRSRPRRRAPESFRALLFEEVMVIAREGRDLDPVFMALRRTSPSTSPSTRSPLPNGSAGDRVRQAGQAEWGVARLPAQSTARPWPTRPAPFWPPRCHRWRPPTGVSWRGLASRPDAHAPGHRGLCPGFRAGFPRHMVGQLHPQGRGTFLLGWAGPASCWLGCSREESGDRRGAALDAGREGRSMVP